MRFEYNPETPDDWPDVISVTASEVGDENGFEEGETRCYEPNWKHRVAGNTIREQRERIHELQGFFKKCSNRYADVFAACGMEAPAIFTPERHEELLGRIADMKALLLDMRKAGRFSILDAEDFDNRIHELGIEVPDEVER